MNTSYRPPGSKSADDIPDGVSALEARLPRIAGKVCELWETGTFESYVATLMMDSRDGARQGLPWDVAQELLFLNELSIAKRAVVASAVTGMPFMQVFRSMSLNAEEASKNPGNSWSNPNLAGNSSAGGRKISDGSSLDTPSMAPPSISPPSVNGGKSASGQRPAVRRLRQRPKRWWERLLGR